MNDEFLEYLMYTGQLDNDYNKNKREEIKKNKNKKELKPKKKNK